MLTVRLWCVAGSGLLSPIDNLMVDSKHLKLYRLCDVGGKVGPTVRRSESSSESIWCETQDVPAAHWRDRRRDKSGGLLRRKPEH